MTNRISSPRAGSAWRQTLFWLAAGAIVLTAVRGDTGETRPRSRRSATETATPAKPRDPGPVADNSERRPERGLPGIRGGDRLRDAPPSDDRVELTAGNDEAGPTRNAGEKSGLGNENLLGPREVQASLPLMGGLTVLSLAPSILLMTTCFVRFTVVFGLLRQALGTQQLPPNSVLSALCLFLTCLVMQPVWRESYESGIRPYIEPTENELRPSLEHATEATLRPIRGFMSEQIERAGNSDTVWKLLEAGRDSAAEDLHKRPAAVTYDDVPFPTLAAAYMLSELQAAFVIGFQILLPFVVIDLVASLLLTTLGVVMLPPATVSFPFKLLLFVLIDGWSLTVGILLESVGH